MQCHVFFETEPGKSEDCWRRLLEKMLPRLQRLHSHLVGTADAAADTSWNGDASHLFADPLPDRLKDEW